MPIGSRQSLAALLVSFALAFLPHAALPQAAHQRQPAPGLLPRERLAHDAFGNDAPWFLANIPFLEIDDAAIQRTYYYRWQLYRSHIRQIGAQGVDVTEFLSPVPWARKPYEDLNDSSSFHILEGRWLRNPAIVQSLIDHLYAGAGDDRHFSESIAAATLAWTQVTGNPAPALRHLDAMQYVYNAWDDHFDAQRNLYWIEPLLDATEYTISSIDASGAGFRDAAEHPGTTQDQNGFTGGQAFRPTINSYQYGNARAIAALAQAAGHPQLAADYTRRADALRQAMLRQLWNPGLTHFTDIYQRSTASVQAGEFIRGRELAGLVPWQFAVPTAQGPYAAGWSHALAESELGGPAGLRTVEPTYARYLVQYRYDAATGQPECQWNGPSWPFQTSQALTGLANLLDDYPHPGVTSADYLRLLRQYTAQYQVDDRLDLQEDYDPQTGRPIVGLPRSHHYNHSTYIDLVLSGLLGIRPHSDAVFEINPLLPQDGSHPIRFFALEDLPYHGHRMTVIFDHDGTHYHLGAGLSIFADGKPLLRNQPLGHLTLPLETLSQAETLVPVDLAANPRAREPSAFEPDLPIASASSTGPQAGLHNSRLWDPLDGRLWFFPEIVHGWSPAADDTLPTYTVDLRQVHDISRVELAFFSDDTNFAAPAAVHLQVQSANGWQDAVLAGPATIIPNGVSVFTLRATRTAKIRVTMTPAAPRQIRLISLAAF